MQHHDARILLCAPPVDAAEALDHALHRHKITYAVIGIQIHPHLRRRGGDENGGPVPLPRLITGDEAQLFQTLGRQFTLEHPPRPGEKLDVGL